MFYRPTTEHLKTQLEEGLRTAFEFATLGAYEPETPAHPVAPRGPQERVFLFAKVAVPCTHSPAPGAACDAGGTVARRRARRGGMAKPAPQPCTWAEPRS